MGIGAGAARIRRRNGHAELGWLIIGSCDTRLRDRHGRLIRGGDEWANSRVATCWARPRPAAAATSTETLGQGQPPFGPTPAPLAGSELPSWHANAAEWAYVIKGQCRVTTINPQGQSQIVDFHAGDVWYFPRGFGHSIQGIGSEDCLFVLVFDNGYFSEFGTFSISDWVGHTPPEVLGKYFGVPASTFANFPKREVYIAKGPVPPSLPANPAPGALDRGPLTHRYQLLAQRPDTYSGGTNRLVSQRQFPISTTVTGALMQIKSGGLREPHWHPNADEWQYYISGRARMSVFGSHGRVRTEEFNAGDVGYVPQGYGHYIENIGNDDVELLIALNNGTYESISLADWIGANPHLLLATNFEVPESTFKDFQTRNRFLVG